MAECILPSSIESSLRAVLDNAGSVNLLLTGKAGTGKTTAAKAIARELGADTLVINASNENGIDVLRTKIMDFASSMSFSDARKIVILDEADYLNPQSTQPALRAFIEEFSQTCCFFLTCNHPNRIIGALHSRCSVVDFTVPKSERAAVMTAFAKRAFEILDLEKVTYDKQLVMEVLRTHFPDFRRVLNELQRFSGTGTLSPDILSQMNDKDVEGLFKVLAAKDFTALRKWMGAHDDLAPQAFYRMLMEQLPDRLKAPLLPEAIVLLADYSYRSAFAADGVLNMLACLTEIMSMGDWK